MNIETVIFNSLSFVKIHDPKELEIKYLRNQFGFDQLVLEDFINKSQIPQIEIYKNYMLMVMDFPSLETPHHPAKYAIDEHKPKLPPQVHLLRLQTRIRRKRIRFGHVSFFIGKDYLVVLHDQRTRQIGEIFAECQRTLRGRQEFMGQGPVYLLYRIIDLLVDSSTISINEISSTIDYIDAQLVEKRTPQVVEDISITRRNIVIFQTMIKPLLPIFSDLEKGRYKELNGQMVTYWSNILNHLQKIWERLEDSRELIEGISLSNESILTYRNNELVKFLTVVTSISFPFVIVNNLYSMNVVGLPFADHPWIIWALFSIIFLTAATIILYFKYRDWL